MAYIKFQANSAKAITPSDSEIITDPNGVETPCTLYVGGDGDLAVVTAADNTVTFIAVPAGSFLPVQVKQVLTASTATDIVGMW